MKEKMMIVMWLDRNGYYFGGETWEHFAERFDLETLKAFQKAFAKYNGLTV